MEFLQHIQDQLLASPIEKIIGYFYMLGILTYIMFLGIRHKSEFWEAIRGADGKLETPEMIIMLVIIVYINLIIADTFLGLTPSEGVFWSLDCIIMFALTGRVMMNKFSGGTKKDEQVVEKTIPQKETLESSISNNDKIAFILKHTSTYEKSDLEKLSDSELNKIHEIIKESENNIDESTVA